MQVKVKVKVTVKQFLLLPGQALMVPGFWVSHISRQSAHKCSQLIIPKHQPPSHPSKYPWHSFLLEADSNSRSYCDRKDYANENFQWRYRESKPQPSDLWCSVSTNCLMAWLIVQEGKKFLVLCTTKYALPCSQDLPLVCLLLSMSAGHILTIHSFKIHIKTIVQSKIIFPKWCLGFRYSV